MRDACLWILIAALGCGEGCSPPPAPEVSATPQTVFARASKALTDGDHATLYRCYQPGTEPLLLLQTHTRALADPTRKGALEALLKRHGVNPAQYANPLQRDAMFAAVTDKPGCFAALLALAPPPPLGTLTEVRIRGAEAIGQAVAGKAAREVLFRKIAGAWYLVPRQRPVSEAHKSRQRTLRDIGRMATQGQKGRTQLAELLAHERDPEVLGQICATLLGMGNPGLSVLLDIGRVREPRTRRMMQEAVYKLPASQTEAIPTLIAALPGNPRIGGVLLETFQQRAAAPLIAALAHTDERVRPHAAALLGLLRPAGALERLTECLTSKALRPAAAAALAAFGARAAPAVPRLIAALRDPSAVDAAVNALASIGKPAVDSLAKALTGSAPVALAAANALTLIGPDAAPAVGQLIASVKREGELALAAARTLGAIGPAAEAAVPTLIAALGHNQLSRRHRTAQEALVRIGTPALPALIQAAEQSDQKLRQSAIAAIGRIQRKTPAVSRALISALAAPQEDVRREAIQSLRATADAAALPRLRTLAGTDRSARVRCAALAAVWALAPDTALPLAHAAAKADPDSACRRLAADVLGRLGPSAAPAYDTLIQLLGDRDWSVRAASARALGKLGDARARTVLEGLRNDRVPLVRDAANAALGQLKR